MKFKKLCAAVLAAVLCVGTVSVTASAGGNGMKLPSVTEDDDDTYDYTDNEDNTPADNDETDNTVTGNDNNNDNTAPTTDGSDAGDDNNDVPPTTGDVPDEETPTTDGSDTGDDNNDVPPTTGDTPDEETPTTDGSDTGDDNNDVPPAADDPVNTEAPETNSSDTSIDIAPASPSTETSDTTNSAAVVAPDETKDAAKTDVKLGETVAVTTEMGEVTVLADKDDSAIEGAKLEVAAIGETAAKLNTVVSADVSDDVKAVVKAAVTAVDDGNAVALEISFTKDGKDVQPSKDVTVTAPVPTALKDADKLFVYHVTGTGLEDVTSKCTYDKDKGTIAISNNAFSPYIVSKVEFKAQSGGTVSSLLPENPANPATGAVLAVIPIILAGAAVAVASVKSRR